MENKMKLLATVFSKLSYELVKFISILYYTKILQTKHENKKSVCYDSKFQQ